MKRYSNLYRKIFEFDTLHAAYLNARVGKRYRHEVLRYTSNLEENLITLQNELIYKMYRVGRYRQHYINEPKKRLIMALPFKDRVLQWSIYLVLNPLFLKGYIEDSYGCIVGRGAHLAIDKLRYWLRQASRQEGRYYCLKLDISKFYYRVDHAVLLDVLRRKIDDEDVMWLLDLIVNSESTSFGLPLDANLDSNVGFVDDKGIPIGNLTSQMFANIYMNEVDQYIKRTLRVKRYIRYMDDMLIISNDKAQLHRWKEQIEMFLNNELKLSLNNKTCIRPIDAGIDFLGYRVWATHTRLRKSTALRMKRRLKKLSAQYANYEVDLDEVLQVRGSYQGLLEHCDSWALRTKLSETFGYKRNTDKMGEQ